MTRQIATSRMTVLLSTALAWLSIGFHDHGLRAEEPPLSVSALDATSRVAEESPDTFPLRPKVELTVRVLELDESLITDGKSLLWKLIPWNKVVENHLKSDNDQYAVAFYRHQAAPTGYRSIYTVWEKSIQQQVQEGKTPLSFTLSQKDVSRFIEEVVAAKSGSIISESDNVVDSGNSPTFRVAHYPLAVRQPVLAQTTRSKMSRQFTVTPHTFQAGTHLAIDSSVEVSSSPSTGWNWLDRSVTPAKSKALSAAGLSVFVPRGEALIVFSLGNGGDGMQPGKPSMLIVTPQLQDREIPAVTSEVLLPPPRLPTVKSPPISNSSRDTITLAAADDSKPGRSRQRNLAELTALREDVRGLREDVRRLSELLEQRLADKPLAPPAVGAKPAPSDRPEFTKVKNGMLFFTAKWCGPCQKMQPMIEKLVGEGLPIQSVDVDQSARLSKQFNVTSIPCFVLLEKGKEIDRVTGLTDERQLRSLLKRVAPVATEVNVELSLSEGQTAIEQLRDNSKPNADPNALIVKTYAVADLVVPLPPLGNADGKPKPPGADAWLKLIDLIVESVDPNTWEENGGPSTIKTYEATLSLVIRAPQTTHVKIAELLNQKRREQDVQTVFETQFLQTNGGLPAELKFEGNDKSRWARLDEQAATKLVATIQAEQETQLFVPKLTVFNGQIAETHTDFRDAGANVAALHLYLRGVATPNRDAIRLNIALNPHHLVNELTSHTYRVPDGGYLLFDMTDEFHRNKSEKPKDRLLVLVRASVHVQKEQEELNGETKSDEASR